MSIDVSTLIAYTAALLGLIGILLLGFWWRERSSRKFLWFSLPFLLGVVGAAFLVNPPIFPGLWNLRLGAWFILLAYGAAWQAARVLCERPPILIHSVWPTLIWLVLSAAVFEPFDLPVVSTYVRLAIVAAFNGLIAWEFWRNREERLPSANMLFWLFALFCGLTVTRLALAPMLPAPLGAAQTEVWSVVTYNLSVIAQALLAAALMIALSRERVSQQNYRMALIDPLTGVRNRRGFDEQLAEWQAQPKAAPATLALLVFDIDRFKAINDQFGHAIGDKVIAIAARTAEQTLRAQDRVFRIGGEEFVCLLPDTTATQAVAAAERLREAFQFAANTVAGQPINATISVGVAAVEDGPIELDRLLRAADGALYGAKRSGRNRSLLAGKAALGPAA
ncbi:GGDEF domain-containing protein [Rhodoligotrophos defluvii]|uniref:GGDEF domain-containing protein n=1 Tax=Rhodoligotrophos defluvii TaxID=2561934 RepID=UPI0014851A05|nr:GGDEF domain-containing protein [Rhodoligotrophos defluvii]